MERIIQLARDLTANLRGQIQARLSGEITLTEREKTGLVVGAAVILLAGWLGLSTWTGGISRQYRTTQSNLSRLKAQVESGAWAERKNEGHVLRSVLEDRFWTADTPGLAEASFERWIRDRLNRSNIEAQLIQVRRVPLVQATDQGAEGNPLFGLQRMTAKVLIPFDETALLALLSEIAESNKVMVVDRLIVRAGRNARVEMDVSTFFRYHERKP
jgi:hypothetical protein